MTTSPSEFVFVAGLKGPEGQLWNETQVNGHGMKKEVLFTQSVDGTKSLDYYIQLYKENVIVPSQDTRPE